MKNPIDPLDPLQIPSPVGKRDTGEIVTDLVAATIAIGITLWLSWEIAKSGEPTSVWLWRDVLGLLKTV